MKKRHQYLNFPCLILVFTTSMSYGLPFSLCKAGNKSALTDATIQYFANSTINSLFTFNFVNYNKLPNQSHLLSVDAWNKYTDYLNQSGLLKAVVAKRLLIGSYFNSISEITSKKDGVWQVNDPFIFVSQSANHLDFQPLIATMTIVFNDKQTYDCGLTVTEIQFTPDISLSIFDKIKSWMGSTQLPYQGINAIIQNPKDEMDLKQPSISDTDVITAVNTWLIKQPNFKPSMLNAPLIIIQKGILQDRFAWKIQVNKDMTVLVTRNNNSPYGLDFQ